jgi:hypothetical protein
MFRLPNMRDEPRRARSSDLAPSAPLHDEASHRHGSELVAPADAVAPVRHGNLGARAGPVGSSEKGARPGLRVPNGS